MPVDPAVFRDAMGHFPSGVCVVTTIDPQSKPWGFTANAFSSLSLEPPLILVCLDRSGQELRLPLIPEAVVHLECSMHQTIPVGDHTILVGNVVGAVVNPGEPLVFHARRYGIMQPHPVV
jgi:flavin reductase (DIM6/NTAB) family NADH-FMN oxidoreductase RutF